MIYPRVGSAGSSQRRTQKLYRNAPKQYEEWYRVEGKHADENVLPVDL